MANKLKNLGNANLNYFQIKNPQKPNLANVTKALKKAKKDLDTKINFAARGSLEDIESELIAHGMAIMQKSAKENDNYLDRSSRKQILEIFAKCVRKSATSLIKPVVKELLVKNKVLVREAAKRVTRQNSVVEVRNRNKEKRLWEQTILFKNKLLASQSNEQNLQEQVSDLKKAASGYKLTAEKLQKKLSNFQTKSESKEKQITNLQKRLIFLETTKGMSEMDIEQIKESLSKSEKLDAKAYGKKLISEKEKLVSKKKTLPWIDRGLSDPDGPVDLGMLNEDQGLASRSARFIDTLT